MMFRPVVHRTRTGLPGTARLSNSHRTSLTRLASAVVIAAVGTQPAPSCAADEQRLVIDEFVAFLLAGRAHCVARRRRHCLRLWAPETRNGLPVAISASPQDGA